MEIYSNTAYPVPDYPAQEPARFHFAFAVPDPAALRDRLISEAATLVVEETLDDGSFLVMMRDPWGVPLQLCKRTKPF